MSKQQVSSKRNYMLGQKQFFMDKVINLKDKAEMINNVHRAVAMIDEGITPQNFEENQLKKEMM